MKNTKKKAGILKKIGKLEKLRDVQGVPQSTLDDVEAQITNLQGELAKCDQGCDYDGAKAPSTKKGTKVKIKKPDKISDAEVDSDLERCREVVKSNRPAPKERVQHNRETRLKTALKTVANVCLEGNEEDVAMIEKMEKKILKFEIELKREFLGLKMVKPSPELKQKFEKAIEHADAASG